MKKYSLWGIVVGFVTIGFLPIPVVAQYITTVTPQNQSLQVDIKVKSLNQTNYQDNLSLQNYSFQNNDNVLYQILITNKTNNQMDNVSVTDILDNKLQPVLYPGTLNSNNNSVSWTIDKLNKGESKTYNVRAKVVNVDTSQASTRMDSTVEVKKDSIDIKDTATVYAGKLSTPNTGSEGLVVKIAAVLGVVVLAWGARKMIRGY